MLGIAAGLSDDACIGDIIAPNLIWDYGAGRWSDESGESEFQARVQPHDIDLNIVKRYYKMSLDKVFLEVCHKTWLLVREDAGLYAPPKVEVAPMVSGAAVISAQSVLKRIKNLNDKICGLDMEAFGVAHAVKCATGPLYAPRCLVIKSVCDFGFAKDKKGQRYAALTSTLFFRKYVEDYILKADFDACPRYENIPKFF